jgi:FkbM family methyltransferase
VQDAGGPRDQLWHYGRQARDWLQARRAWAPFESLVYWAAPRIVPPSPLPSVVTLPYGTQLELPPGLSASLAYREGYEIQLTDWVRQNVRSGWTVIDGGANIGYYTVLFSRCVGDSGRVIAFEPDPTNFEYLTRNLRTNHCDNVEACQAALSNLSGSAGFRPDPFRAEGRLVSDAHGDRKSITVRTVRFDEFVASRQLESVDLVKLDLEGGEIRALEGMRTTLGSSRNPLLVVECSPAALRRSGVSPADLLRSLRHLGFARVRSIEPPGPEFALDGSGTGAGYSQNFLAWR